MNGNEIQLKILNKLKLIQMLKKCANVQDSTLLEVRLNDYILVKAFNEELSVLKFLKEDFSSIFEVEDEALTTVKSEDVILIPIFDVKKFISILDFLSDGDNITLQFTHSSEKQKNSKKTKTKKETEESPFPDSYYETHNILLQSKKTHFNLKCTYLGMFEYLKDEKFNEIYDIENYITKFNLSIIEKRNVFKLMDLEDANGLVEVKYNKDKNTIVFAEGKAWQFKIETDELDFSSDCDSKGEIKIHKKNLKFIDDEEYDVYMHDLTILLQQKNSNNCVILGAALLENE